LEERTEEIPVIDAGICALMMAQAQMECERHEVLAIQRLPPELQSAAYKAMEERRERLRIYATEERRHRELCDAILEAGRSASFWP
jgi:hypothetical protein